LFVCWKLEVVACLLFVVVVFEHRDLADLTFIVVVVVVVCCCEYSLQPFHFFLSSFYSSLQRWHPLEGVLRQHLESSKIVIDPDADNFVTSTKEGTKKRRAPERYLFHLSLPDANSLMIVVTTVSVWCILVAREREKRGFLCCRFCC